MSEPKATPAPWTYYERYKDSYSVRHETEDGNITEIAWLGQSSQVPSEENLANVELICLAPFLPELLEAAEEVLKHCYGCEDCQFLSSPGCVWNKLQYIVKEINNAKKTQTD